MDADYSIREKTVFNLEPMDLEISFLHRSCFASFYLQATKTKRKTGTAGFYAIHLSLRSDRIFLSIT